MLNAKTVLERGYLTQSPKKLWPELARFNDRDEQQCVSELLTLLKQDYDYQQSSLHAQTVIGTLRGNSEHISLIDDMLLEYNLNTPEGLLLMSLCETLLRVPDSVTAQQLIEDKLAQGNWLAHKRKSSRMGVNLLTRGILFTHYLLNLAPRTRSSWGAKLTKQLSAPIIRLLMRKMLTRFGKQFVIGEKITRAIDNSRRMSCDNLCFSFDMLGEAALTATVAYNYQQAYLDAIESIGQFNQTGKNHPSSISIKLSALHPRYDSLQKDHINDALINSLVKLIETARAKQVAITLDAEEADQLELSLMIFKQLLRHPCTQNWGKLGIAVQAYSKRAPAVLAYLAALAHEQDTLIPVRLVKGAYWDSEIKWAQQKGLTTYPVFTRKESTNTSFLACAQILLNPATEGLLYPQFATHNALTVCSIMQMAPSSRSYEFQRLYGMGDALYQQLLAESPIPLRIYAPVGKQRDLLPYLVRRLLENGANSSFIHRLADPKIPTTVLIEDPIEKLIAQTTTANPRIPLPPAIFGENRPNSLGIDLHRQYLLDELLAQCQQWEDSQWQAGGFINGKFLFDSGQSISCHACFDEQKIIGTYYACLPHHVTEAINHANQAWEKGDILSENERIQSLERFAQLLQENQAELIALCQYEAGKTLGDAIDEIREAIDFCHYYTMQAKQKLFHQSNLNEGAPQTWQSCYRSRGVIACISPWNFPLAIFCGQIVAALVTGNTVVAKAAPQTALIAQRACELMHQAGIPINCLHLITGDASIGESLLSHPAIAGVAFTGSLASAQRIHLQINQRNLPPCPLIAETGGINAMLVDSSALPEQVVKDVLRSAFASAGQRCSALRVLCVQEEIADEVIEQLTGAMRELVVDHPLDPATDIGPIIDTAAFDKLSNYLEHLHATAKFLAQTHLPQTTSNYHLIAPSAWEISTLAQLTEEQFGPILHILRYRSQQLPKLIKQLNELEFGLTLGVHSRIEQRYQLISREMQVGNCYINRDQIGAVVGSQPFGGRALSGTGPKAGGPYYLFRFCTHYRIDTPVQES